MGSTRLLHRLKWHNKYLPIGIAGEVALEGMFGMVMVVKDEAPVTVDSGVLLIG